MISNIGPNGNNNGASITPYVIGASVVGLGVVATTVAVVRHTNNKKASPTSARPKDRISTPQARSFEPATIQAGAPQVRAQRPPAPVRPPQRTATQAQAETSQVEEQRPFVPSRPDTIADPTSSNDNTKHPEIEKPRAKKSELQKQISAIKISNKSQSEKRDALEQYIRGAEPPMVRYQRLELIDKEFPIANSSMIGRRDTEENIRDLKKTIAILNSPQDDQAKHAALARHIDETYKDLGSYVPGLGSLEARTALIDVNKYRNNRERELQNNQKHIEIDDSGMPHEEKRKHILKYYEANSAHADDCSPLSIANVTFPKASDGVHSGSQPAPTEPRIWDMKDHEANSAQGLANEENNFKKLTPNQQRAKALFMLSEVKFDRYDRLENPTKARALYEKLCDFTAGNLSRNADVRKQFTDAFREAGPFHEYASLEDFKKFNVQEQNAEIERAFPNDWLKRAAGTHNRVVLNNRFRAYEPMLHPDQIASVKMKFAVHDIPILPR